MDISCATLVIALIVSLAWGAYYYLQSAESADMAREEQRKADVLRGEVRDLYVLLADNK